MTFEEFLIKKKIDLIQFKGAEPDLFGEFQGHYNEMGEKSFDHTKKFWFNKLRRAYHLKEEPKPVVAAEFIEINEVASQAEPLISPTVEATVYTPRFKPRGVSTPKPPDQPEADAREPEDTTAAVTSPANSSDLESKTIEPPNQAKPAFKPRFRTGETSPPESSHPGPVENKAKQAYIPRFKAPASSPADSPSKNVTEENSAAPQEKPASSYKPRFKAKAIPSKETDSNDTSSTPPISDL